MFTLWQNQTTKITNQFKTEWYIFLYTDQYYFSCKFSLRNVYFGSCRTCLYCVLSSTRVSVTIYDQLSVRHAVVAKLIQISCTPQSHDTCVPVVLIGKYNTISILQLILITKLNYLHYYREDNLTLMSIRILFIRSILVFKVALCYSRRHDLVELKNKQFRKLSTNVSLT